jgi:hypothetical protein
MIPEGEHAWDVEELKICDEGNWEDNSMESSNTSSMKKSASKMRPLMTPTRSSSGTSSTRIREQKIRKNKI